MDDVKYPDVEVELVGHDGNAYFIIGRVIRAMQKTRIPQEEIDKFREEAMSGNYDHLLQTCMKWVDVT